MVGIENYSCRVFENFSEVMESKYETAMLLLKELGLTRKDIGKEPWMDDELRVFFSPTHYALYELTDGLYGECDLNRSFGIYPNPFDYINTEHFGEDLIDVRDKRCCRLLPNGCVVTTSYGW